MSTQIDEQKRDKLQKMLKDMGFITDEPKYFSPEDLAQAFTAISNTQEFKDIIGGYRGIREKCGRSVCNEMFVSYGINDNYVRFCSEGCKLNYIKNELFMFSSKERDIINAAFEKGEVDIVINMIKDRINSSKSVHGLKKWLAEQGGIGYQSIYNMCTNPKPVVSAKVFISILKSAGIILKVR